MNDVKADRKRWGSRPVCGVPQYTVVKWKRICERWREVKPLYLAARMIYRHVQIKYGVNIPAQTKNGQGFQIEHTGGIVINPEVQIGKNCNLCNGVTIGREKRGKRIGVPVIGDRVWIGANAVIVGNIRIGSDVLIAPGSFVNFDVPDHSIVLGNPAKVIPRENATETYITNTV